MKLFEVRDVLGNRIVLTRERWNHAWRHDIPGMDSLKRCVRDPDEIRRSRSDPDIRLYYRRQDGDYLCVVVQMAEGFITTAYEARSMKEGETVWKKN